MAIEDVYFSRYTLYSNSVTGRTATGGIVRTAVVKQASTPCYLTLLSGKEQEAYGKRSIIANHLLMCAPCDMLSSDLVLVGTRWFQIAYIDNSDELFHHIEVALLAIEAPQSFSATPPEAP